MTVSTHFEQLMQCLIQVVARAAIREDRVRAVVGAGSKQLRAFNLADGTKSQQQIAKATGIDQGQLSRTFQRWVENGVAFWMGEGKETRLLHVYPMSAGDGQARKGGKRRKGR